MYFLYFGTITQRFARHYTGTTIKHLTGKALSQVEFPVPPLNEQRRIVAKIEELFSDLDAGVAALERAKANLKRYRAAVLKAAVEGRLTQEWRSAHPDVEPASELLKRILAERSRNWEADKLAEYEAKGKKPPKNWKDKYKEPVGPDTNALSKLPEGWCWVTLAHLVQRSEYGTSVKCDYNASGVPVLRIPNIAGGVIDLADLKFATKTIPQQPIDSLQVGDLLMCRTNGSIKLVGKTALVQSAFEIFHSFASYLLRFRFVLATSLPSWVNIYCTSAFGRSFIESHAASSAGQHNISLSLMHGMPLPLPPVAEQQQIAKLVEETITSIERAERDCQINVIRADRLRQSILQKAFEGTLVPQDPNDEPAATLLERIKRQRKAASKKAPKTKGGGTKTMSKKRRPLREVLQEHPDGLSPEDLLKESGSTLEHVEQFYRELREMSDEIEEIRPDGESTNQWPMDAQITLKLRSA